MVIVSSNFTATQYFRIDRNYPDAARLIGPYNGEFVPDMSPLFGHGIVYLHHLASGFSIPQSNVSRRYASEGTGSVVVEGISYDGWHMLSDAACHAETRNEVLDVLIGLPYITWDREHQDIGRANAMARAA